MLNFPPAVRIWLGTAPVDLRRSFDGLAEQVRQQLHNDPLSGHILMMASLSPFRITRSLVRVWGPSRLPCCRCGQLHRWRLTPVGAS